MRIGKLLFIAAVLMTNVVSASAPDEPSTISKIEHFGGKITRDDESPHKPVTKIDFRSCKKITKGCLLQLTLFKNLTELSLSGTNVTNVSLKEISKLKNLTTLDLDNTLVTDFGLKELKGFNDLTTLRIDSTRVSDTGLKEIANNDNLTILSLNNTQVTDADLKSKGPEGAQTPFEAWPLWNRNYRFRSERA